MASTVYFTRTITPEKVVEMFDLRPGAIEQNLGLRNPIYAETASYGHMGRRPEKKLKEFSSRYDGDKIEKEVELFTWEKLDRMDDVKREFGIS